MIRLPFSGKIRALPLLQVLLFSTLFCTAAGLGTQAKTYSLNSINSSSITIDGQDSEPSWKLAEEDSGFSWPWKEETSPLTLFKAFYTDEFVYFFFDVTDSNIVIFPDTDEGSVARGDRVEMFFSADPDMKEYYCLEIDPSGKVLDYKASFYRDFDRDWDLRGLQTSGRITDKGYSVEVAIPVEWYRQTEISSMRQGTRIIAGIYRGEFSRTRDGRIDQSWISWQDPRTDKPDFHIPSALGFFTLD